MSDLVERLRSDIEGWERAYPLSVFPEPDLKRAEAILKMEGVSLGAISASNMRHVVSCLAPGIHESLAHIETLQAELAEARAKVERAREDALEEARWAAHCSVCDLAFTRDGEQLAPADYSNAMTAAIRSLAKGWRLYRLQTRAD